MITAKEDYHYESPDDKAERLGLTVRRPQPRELFIDIDSTEGLKEFQKRFKLMTEFYPLHIAAITPSRTPEHYHVVVASGTGPYDPKANDGFDNIERVMLQLALGSDPIREILALRQMEEGKSEDAIVFFELPPAKATPQKRAEAVEQKDYEGSIFGEICAGQGEEA